MVTCDRCGTRMEPGGIFQGPRPQKIDLCKPCYDSWEKIVESIDSELRDLGKTRREAAYQKWVAEIRGAPGTVSTLKVEGGTLLHG